MRRFETCEDVLKAYMEGSRRLDRDLLADCFHPAAVMNGYLAGQLLMGGPQPFFEDVARMAVGGVRHDRFSAEIVSLEVQGRTASGAVRMSAFGDALDFKDFFHLIEDEGGWRIVSKTFTSLS